MERDLGEARLLFRGSASAAWGYLAVVAWVITIGVGLAIGEGNPVPAALGIGALVSVELMTFVWVLRSHGWARAGRVRDGDAVRRVPGLVEGLRGSA